MDRNDRDSADYSNTIKTVRYYLRIFCWVLDRVVHTVFVVVVSLASVNVGKPEWKKYASKHNGRHDFQIDLAISIINRAIAMEWDDESKRPDWMRQKEFVPCNCGDCYFCLNGYTTGIQHRAKKQKLKLVCPRTGTITRTDKCVDEAVPLDRGSDYCRQCMRNCIGEIGKNGKKLNFRKRKKLCTYSTKG